MADDIQLSTNVGTGEVLATDQAAGGEHYQVVKLADGTADSTTHIPLSGTLANGLDVDVTRVGGTVTVDGSGVTQPVSNAGLTELAAAINASSQMDVNLAASSATVTVDLGANNDVINAGTFAVQEDGAALTALQLIDDAVHTDDAAFTLGTSKGVMMMGFAGAQSVNANDAAALACDTDGALHISDGGNTITVDGTVTETNSGAILADTANMDTNLGTVAGAVSGSEMQVDVVAALPAGTNTIGKLGANSGVDIGDVDVTSIAAGSNLIGDVGISGARTSGGTTLYKNIDVDESEDQVKGSAGQVYWIHAMNLSASPLYLKIYNALAASVTVGTTTPDMTFPLATQGDTNGAGFTLSIPNGIAFDTGITIAATTGVADNDSGAPGANACVVNLGYA